MCVVASVAGTYIVKQSEISDLTSKHESEKNVMELQIQNFQNLEEDWHDFVRFMINGYEDYAEALLNKGYAESDYEAANKNFNSSFFVFAMSNADSADDHYADASESFTAARSDFEAAENVAPNNKTLRLARLYVNMTNIGVQTMDEMYQACQYYVTACNYYSNGWWDKADDEVDTMNEHIDAYSVLILDYTNYLSEIDGLLTTF